MLISFSCENVLSFKEQQYLSMLASNKKKEDILQFNVLDYEYKKDKFLKSALIFGANANGKTNFINALSFLRDKVLFSLNEVKKDSGISISPFLFSQESIKSPNEFEIEFISNEIKYRYGLALEEENILEEWLYYTQSRETLLFHREKDKIVEKNDNSFKEINIVLEKNVLTRTKESVPLVTVLSALDGEHSTNVTDWFSNLEYMYFTAQETEFNENLRETLIYWKSNKYFQEWARPLFNAVGIHDIKFNHVEIKKQNIINFFDHQLENFDMQSKKIISQVDDLNTAELVNKNTRNIMDSLLEIIDKTIDDDVTRTSIDLDSLTIVKKFGDLTFDLPFNLESSGVKKVLYLINKLYNASFNNAILVIDEFDTHFHTLLSEYIFEYFHKTSKSLGQIIVTTHDTNLIDTNSFRRDQIWFINKNLEGISQLYSLVQYKELAIDIADRNYSREYLRGNFDAIPLFDNIEQIVKLMED